MRIISEEEADDHRRAFYAELDAMRTPYVDHGESMGPFPLSPDIDRTLGTGYRGKRADRDLGVEHRLHGVVVPESQPGFGSDPGLFGGWTMR